MKNATQKISLLFFSDQKDRASFRNGEIDTAELERRDETRQAEFWELANEMGCWPRLSDFGEEICTQFLALALHHHDLGRQQRLLQWIICLPKGEKLLRHEAYLCDRVLVREGKSQRFGTQYRIGKDGNQEQYPIDDPDNLNSHRTQYGFIEG